MEDPVAEIPTVLHLLTQSTPSLQELTIEKFFTPSAAFTHPFCRVPSFACSRWLIVKIYQWYKIMSPRIEAEVHSVAFDEQHLKLYVSLSQIFSIWLFPFHVAPVELTVVLTLTMEREGDKRLYYIQRQDDLYPATEWIKFLLPHVGHWIVMAVHLFATVFCIVGVYALWPVMWLEEKRVVPEKVLTRGNLLYDVGRKMGEIKKE